MRIVAERGSEQNIKVAKLNWLVDGGLQQCKVCNTLRTDQWEQQAAGGGRANTTQNTGLHDINQSAIFRFIEPI